MHCSAMCPKAYADEIMTARKAILSRWGATSIDPYSAPLDHGPYIGMFLNGGDYVRMGGTRIATINPPEFADGITVDVLKLHALLRQPIARRCIRTLDLLTY